MMERESSMPTYEYECEKCGNRFEVFQRMSEEPLKLCSHCNEQTLRRVFSGGLAINFKGTGFYANDSKMPKSKDSQKPASSACSSCGSASCASCGK